MTMTTSPFAQLSVDISASVTKTALDDPQARLAMLREVRAYEVYQALRLPTPLVQQVLFDEQGFPKGIRMNHCGTPVARLLGQTWRRPHMHDLAAAAYGLLRTQARFEDNDFILLDNHLGNYLVPVSSPASGFLCFDQIVHIDCAFDLLPGDGRPIQMALSPKQFPELAKAATADRNEFLTANGYTSYEEWAKASMSDMLAAFNAWERAVRLRECFENDQIRREYQAQMLRKMFARGKISFLTAAQKAHPHPLQVKFMSLCDRQEHACWTTDELLAELEALLRP